MATKVIVDLSRCGPILGNNGKLLYLPPGATIVAMKENSQDYSMQVFVEYPFDWRVQRVSGDRGDLVGADFDYGMEAE